MDKSIEVIVSNAINEYEESLKIYFPEIFNKLSVTHKTRFLNKFFKKEPCEINCNLQVGDEVIFIHEISPDEYKRRYIITGLKPKTFYPGENISDTEVTLKTKWANDKVEYTTSSRSLKKVN